MGLFLLITLSLFFGWIFSEGKNREIEKLQSQLLVERNLHNKEKSDLTFAVNKLKATIREML